MPYHQKLADLAVVAGIGSEGDSTAVLANAFIQAIRDLRGEMDMPLKPEGLKRNDITSIVNEAATEAGTLYPVPRYLSKAEITELVVEKLA
jgi:alcohol dehydrogenase class IV